MVAGVHLHLNHPSENQDTISVIIYPPSPQNQHSNQRKERTTEGRKKEGNTFTPKTWVEAEDLWSDGAHTEMCTSMKDCNCKGAENGAKLATEAAYAFGFINFMKLAVWEEDKRSLFWFPTKKKPLSLHLGHLCLHGGRFPFCTT